MWNFIRRLFSSRDAQPHDPSPAGEAATRKPVAPRKRAASRRSRAKSPLVATAQHLELAAQIGKLLLRSAQYTAPDRAQSIMLKWLPKADGSQSGERETVMSADAARLSADLLFSLPSASGSTALDRMARSHAADGSEDAPIDAGALAALRAARYRLLRLARASDGTAMAARDTVTDEVLLVAHGTFPPLAAGTALFARTVTLGDGFVSLPCPITPLDAAAFAVASGHRDAGAIDPAANARWADAVFCHVVRHGTVGIPGLNRQGWEGQDSLSASVDPRARELLRLTERWLGLGDRQPDEALVERTREFANAKVIIEVLIGATIGLDPKGDGSVARGFETMLSVLVDTVIRRESSGSGKPAVKAVEHAIDAAIADGRLPRAARTLFDRVAQRVAMQTGARVAGDPALERLMQRIQGLRAKTVERGCTEQEALSAAEKVAELLDRYGLSLGELDFKAQACEGISIQTNRRRSNAIDSCVSTVAAFFECRVWVERAPQGELRYVFFGLRGDVAAAQYLYEMVEHAFEAETNTFRSGRLYAKQSDRRSATNSFQIGLASGIITKLRTLRTSRDAQLRSASGRDLVPVKAALVDEELSKLGLSLQQGQAARSKTVLAGAFHAGKAAGDRFEFASAATKAA